MKQGQGLALILLILRTQANFPDTHYHYDHYYAKGLTQFHFYPIK
jgi:hypothetical protein